MTTLEEVIKSFPDDEYAALCAAITDLFYESSENYSNETDLEKKHRNVFNGVRFTKLIHKMDEVRS